MVGAFRTLTKYKPWVDLMKRWPTWKVRFVRLPPKTEKEIRPDEQVILIDENIDPAVGVAQAVSHLDLGHHDAADGTLTCDQYTAARWLAKLRLDAAKSRPPEMVEVDDNTQEE